MTEEKKPGLHLLDEEVDWEKIMAEHRSREAIVDASATSLEEPFRDYVPSAAYDPHATDVCENYDQACTELTSPMPSIQIPSMPMLMKITGGLRPNEFSIFCGSTGTGKTTFMANLSASLLTQKIPHFVASVETGHTDFTKRVISAMAQEDWNSGEAIPQERIDIFTQQHGGKFFSGKNLRLSLYDNRFSVKTLMADIAHSVRNHGAKIAIIDNLNFFLEVTRATDQIVEMDRVIHELIIFCKRIPVHVVMVMHPKKTDGSRVESEFDIKGSSTAVQEAHNVFLWNRPSEDLVQREVARKDDRELSIAKMRRRGKYVGKRLLFHTVNCVTYQESVVV